MSSIRISLLHPFSAKAIGLTEKDLYFSHSQPHEKALRKIQSKDFKVSIAYFTGNVIPYSKNIEGVKKQFWPITKPMIRRKHKWRKQYSFWHYLNTFFKPADCTINNMSGHGSGYIFKLGELLVKKNKPYLAMIGGLHMSMTGNALNYYKNAEHLIVHTNLQKQELQKNKDFQKLDIRVMPLGIDIEKFKPIKRENSNNLLYVGRISRLKQLEIAIEAVAKLIENKIEDVRFIIIGPESDKNYFKELKDLIIKLNIEKNVIFKGVIAHEKLISYYQNADLLLLPSAHESFGMVMVESMACGTPVAAIKGSGGPDEIVDDGFNGLLNNKNNYGLNILEYFKNNEMRNRFSKEARSKVLKEYSIEKTYKVLKKSVEDILD